MPPWWEPGTIYLAATPIGNADDATERLLYALQNADVIAAEDTRRVRALVSRLEVQIAGKVVAFHDHNENAKVNELCDAAESGATVLVVSDAGTPTVSDPGYHLVSAATKRGIPLTSLPGPSAALAALAVSGLPTNSFTFEGFLPRKTAEQKTKLAALASEQRTLILFESPRRIMTTLANIRTTFGPDRKMALCRELTKTHEEVVRGTVMEVIEAFADREVLGEVTLVLGGAPEKNLPEANYEELGKQVRDLAQSEGLRLKEAAGRIAQEHGVRKNDLYEAALQV